MEQIIDGLRRAAGAELDARTLTSVLETAFTERNRLDAALTAAIGALDRAGCGSGRSPTESRT